MLKCLIAVEARQGRDYSVSVVLHVVDRFYFGFFLIAVSFPFWSGGFFVGGYIFFRSVRAKSEWVVQQTGEKGRLFERNENTTSIDHVGVDIKKHRVLCGLWSDQKDPLDPLSSSFQSLIDFIGYIGKETCIDVQNSYFLLVRSETLLGKYRCT